MDLEDMNTYVSEQEKGEIFFDRLDKLYDWMVLEYDPDKETIRQYIKEHPELLVSMLCLDVGLEETTTPVLELLFDRIPKGGIVTFDTIGFKGFPGQNIGLYEFFKGYSNLRIERLPFEPARTYFIKE